MKEMDWNMDRKYLKKVGMWMWIGALVLAIFYQGRASAEPPALEMALAGPKTAVQSGGNAGLTVFFHNPGNADVPSRDYERLECLVFSRGRRHQVEAVAVTDLEGVVIKADGVLKLSYEFMVPREMKTDFQLRLKDHDTARAVYQVDGSVEPSIAGPSKQWSVRVAEEYYYSLADKITPYEPVYFLFGVDPGMEKSSFQISFKFQFFDPEGELGETVGWLDGFYLGYTQKSLWDLDSDSAPFEDTSYKPEVFYRLDGVGFDLPWVKSSAMQLGYKHESNGRGGLESRSTNRLYLTPYFLFPLWSSHYLSLAPTGWIYVNNSDEDNPDLADYRGYFQLETSVGSPDGLVLSTLFRPAEKGNTFQADLSYPLNRILGDRFNLFLHAQFYTGYAETLLHYDQRCDIFRLGVSIVR